MVSPRNGHHEFAINAFGAGILLNRGNLAVACERVEHCDAVAD
jgi:hypothetical protein